MIDSHCHLNDAKFEKVDEIVNNYLTEGINKVVCIGCNNESNKKAKQIANEYESVYYSVGIHPDDYAEFDEELFENYLKIKDNKLVAVGEIGLDYHTTKENKEEQKKVFVSQIKLAQKYHLPVVIHCRDAYGDMLEILKQFAPFDYGAVMHCYCGSLEFANEILNLGLKISFTGNVTFSNAKNVQEVAKNIPLNSFFLETDSPYMAPTPLRGTRNEPKNVKLIAQFVADLRGITFAELNKITDENAKNFFKI